MATLEGNVLRPPGFGPTVTFDPPAELLASTGHGYVQKGGTLVQNGEYRVGEPVRRVTTGNLKRWEKTTFANAQGLIRNAVDTTDGEKLGNIVLSGAVNANVPAILPANGAALATALGGKYFPHFEYIIF